jgi:hypothetical protein
MAIGVHFVRLGLFTVDINGARIDKSGLGASINTMKSTSMEFLVIPDATVPNSSGYPTMKEYIKLEADDNYVVSHIDQSIIITYNQSQVNSA